MALPLDVLKAIQAFLDRSQFHGSEFEALARVKGALAAEIIKAEAAAATPPAFAARKAPADPAAPVSLADQPAAEAVPRRRPGRRAARP